MHYNAQRKKKGKVSKPNRGGKWARVAEEILLRGRKRGWREDGRGNLKSARPISNINEELEGDVLQSTSDKRGRPWRKKRKRRGSRKEGWPGPGNSFQLD